MKESTTVWSVSMLLERSSWLTILGSAAEKNQFLSAAPSPQVLTVCILNAAKTIKQNPSFWLLCLSYFSPLGPQNTESK